MIRTILGSPWSPLLYWAATVIAMICGARHESQRRRLRHQQVQTTVSASAPTPARPDAHSAARPQLDPASQRIAAMSGCARFWYPQISVFQRPSYAIDRPGTEIAPNRTPISTKVQTALSASITMLSIRADPPEPATAKTLAIQCRTSVAFGNAHGRVVTIHGVVTQEVVSSTGRILIMAGSRVLGSGILDPENGRFKSDGLWSIFFDDSELNVRARLLDRPAGLPGMLGKEAQNGNEPFRREAVVSAARFIFVPRNAPFTLEIHGEPLLHDLKSNEARN